MARARAGEPRAFRALYDMAFRLAWAWSLRTTGHPSRAERLTSATLRRAFETLAEYDGSESLGGWLLRHARAALAENAEAPPSAGPALAGEAPS